MRVRASFLGILCFGLALIFTLGTGSTGFASLPSLQRVHDIKTIQIIVQQSFGDAEPKTLPFYRVAKSILENKGFRIVDENNIKNDVQLLITAEGTASADIYSGGTQYSGAEVDGNLTLNRDGESIWTGVFVGNIPPAKVITKRFRNPSDAPFEKAFDESGYELIIRSLAYFLGDESSLREITDALGDRRTVIRSKALEILSEVGASKTLPAVLARLKDSDPGVRLSAVRALSVYERQETFSSVLSMLSDEDINVRREAAHVLGQIRDSRAIPPLISLLKNDGFIRATVKNSLLNIGEPSVEPLIALLQDAGINPLAREEAVEVLGKLRDPRAVAPLIHSLESSDRWEQKEAVDALCSIGRDAVKPLMTALKDPKPAVRRGAAKILGRLKASEALPVLLERLTDTDSDVRYQTAWALGELGEPLAVQYLEKLALDDSDETVRQMAEEAVQNIRRNTRL